MVVSDRWQEVCLFLLMGIIKISYPFSSIANSGFIFVKILTGRFICEMPEDQLDDLTFYISMTY
jgi:hypothetical protein